MMEYFLYGVAEADHLVEQIKAMEGDMKTMSADIGDLQASLERTTTSLDKLAR